MQGLLVFLSDDWICTYCVCPQVEAGDDLAGRGGGCVLLRGVGMFCLGILFWMFGLCLLGWRHERNGSSLTCWPA